MLAALPIFVATLTLVFEMMRALRFKPAATLAFIMATGLSP